MISKIFNFVRNFTRNLFDFWGQTSLESLSLWERNWDINAFETAFETWEAGGTYRVHKLFLLIFCVKISADMERFFLNIVTEITTKHLQKHLKGLIFWESFEKGQSNKCIHLFYRRWSNIIQILQGEIASKRGSIG